MEYHTSDKYHSPIEDIIDICRNLEECSACLLLGHRGCGKSTELNQMTETGGRSWNMYTEQELVRIARRENNNRRKYLVVNRLQGKHIPVKPGEALAMFRALADTVRGVYGREKILVIGFAETATAIGAAVAAELGADYMQTTREELPGVRYLYFSEEHSHATEQKLVRDDLDGAAGAFDRILFVEDEVTTGKTIRNIIGVLKKQYGEKISFSVASVLNGMDKTALEAYWNNGIELFWLVKTDHFAYTRIAESYRGDGTYIVCRDSAVRSMDKYTLTGQKAGAVRVPEKTADFIGSTGIRSIRAHGRMDTRRLVHSAEYQQFCESFYQDLVSREKMDGAQSILVLGTEEYMYPALYVAGRLEAQGKDVRFHATTRSPIAVSTEEDYPLQTRYELCSLYDGGRITYIYDLHKYDMVVIITDAAGEMTEGICSLVHALRLCGNEQIVLVQCKETS